MAPLFLAQRNQLPLARCVLDLGQSDTSYLSCGAGTYIHLHGAGFQDLTPLYNYYRCGSCLQKPVTSLAVRMQCSLRNPHGLYNVRFSDIMFAQCSLFFLLGEHFINVTICVELLPVLPMQIYLFIYLFIYLLKLYL